MPCICRTVLADQRQRFRQRADDRRGVAAGDGRPARLVRVLLVRQGQAEKQPVVDAVSLIRRRDPSIATRFTAPRHRRIKIGIDLHAQTLAAWATGVEVVSRMRDRRRTGNARLKR